MIDPSRVVGWVGECLAGGGRFLLLTDYDGTLTSFAPSPDEAWLDPQVREDLCALERTPGIALGIVSGRDLGDLRERVAVPDAIYAGCHGLEIDGPGMSFAHPEAIEQQATLAEIGVELTLRAPTVPGMYVEIKRFGLAVHYRAVPEDMIRRVQIEVARAIRLDGSRLRVFHGDKVIEIQPQVAWNKGDCARFISEAVRRRSSSPLTILYMGDDWTDEQAFEALAGQAITIRVGGGAPASRAAYRLSAVADVHEFLTALASCGTGR